MLLPEAGQKACAGLIDQVYHDSLLADQAGCLMMAAHSMAADGHRQPSMVISQHTNRVSESSDLIAAIKS